jgi:hypothetical protein
MAGIFLLDSLRLWLRRRKRQKEMQLALQWPTTTGEVNHWAVVTADEEAAAMGAPYQIEASFHFILNGEYYGGYFRSVAMAAGEADRLAKGNPTVNVRYNSTHPDSCAVLSADNMNNLPFRVFSESPGK